MRFSRTRLSDVLHRKAFARVQPAVVGTLYNPYSCRALLPEYQGLESSVFVMRQPGGVPWLPSLNTGIAPFTRKLLAGTPKPVYRICILLTSVLQNNQKSNLSLVCHYAILQIMGEQKKTKINRLHDLLAEGLVAPTRWLEKQGYSRALLSKYVESGWLVSPARGVYRRPGPELKWQHVVASLQLLADSYLHVGGRTALVHHGFGHYVRMSGAETIFLYGAETLPGWVNQLPVPEHFVVRNDAMFSRLRARRGESGKPVDIHEKPILPNLLADFGLQEVTWGAWDWRLLFSSEERAMLEVLQDVPARESVHEADTLMQGLASLRPARVTALLESCASVKVKRLFLALAERHQHPWLRHVDLTKVDLGKGKRMLAPGGRLHPKYLITLPADLDDHAR
jgi:hypothetical protein